MASVGVGSKIDGVQVPADVVQRSFEKNHRIIAEAQANERRKRIDPPELTQDSLRDAFEQNGSSIIDYTYFSLVMSRTRRFCRWVGWNIDRGGPRNLGRKGIPFVLDPKLPAKTQIGEDLYSGNGLDRGHIAGGAGLLWGSLAEAKTPNTDSFFLTNITPQMDEFNQGGQGGFLWDQGLYGDRTQP